ncbi:response regulator, partial [Nostoc sp. UCD120]
MEILKILLVEDDPDWQDLLQGYIKDACNNTSGKTSNQEYKTEAITTFTDSQKKLQDNDWHLLVTDIGLRDSRHSDKDKLGIHLVKLAHKKKIPTIVVSGTPVLGSRDTRDLLKKDDVADYFSKR